VVNGQWIKGVGGAAVWSAINYSDIGGTPPPATLPPRLQAGATLAISDCNLATDSGWYHCPGGATANTPVGDWGMLNVSVLNDPTNTRQVFWSYSQEAAWTRRRQAGVWQAWYQSYPVPEHCATYGAGFNISAQDGWASIGPTGYVNISGNYMVEFGGMFTKPEAYDSQIGIFNGSGMVAYVHMPRNAGSYQHAHWKQNIYFSVGQMINFRCQYDGPAGNPMLTHERYLKWTFTGPTSADSP
jgi:hypothetical protein